MSDKPPIDLNKYENELYAIVYRSVLSVALVIAFSIYYVVKC